jgi:pimaricinolide synthase PimS1
VIKMVMALRHGTLPPSLYCEEPSPHVDWSAGDVRLLAEAEPWERGSRPRRAGVSSFGISGTNVHLIVEEAPEVEEAPAERSEPPALPLVVSARSEAALRAQAARLREWLVERVELEPLDVAYSLASARAQLDRRAVVVGSDRTELVARLDSLARDEAGDGVVVGQARPGKAVFVFPGQGSQWEGMALELLDTQPVFAESMRECGEALANYVDWSLEDVLRGAEGAPPFERVDVVQPALFAVMASLAALWRSYGVEPSAVVGHSQGEIAAAYVAGGLSLDDAARVVCLRSQAVADDLAGRGGMGSVALSPEDAEARLEPYGERLSLAAVNGPASVVVSGEMEALDELLAACEAEGTWARKIPVDYPSHSVAVEGIEERLAQDLGPIAPRSGTVPFFSTVSAELIDTEGLDAAYWYRNLRGRVRFNDAVAALIEDGASAFLEMSPHPGLTVGVAAAADAAGAADRVAAVGSLRRGEGGLERFLASLGEAHAHGVDVDWSQLYEGSGARQVDLPTYAFQRQRFWLEGTGGTGDLAAAGLGAIDHPLLSTGQLLAGADEWLFTGSVSRAAHPWVSDHVVLDTVVLPATAFVEIALAAGEMVGCETVAELTFEAPLVLGEHDAAQLQARIEGPDESGRRAIAVYSRAEGSQDDGEDRDWTRHASGAVAPVAEAGPSELVERVTAEAWPPEGAEELDVDGIYDRLSELGFAYGPSFMGIRAAWRRGDELFAEAALDDDDADDAERFGVHPALFDSSMHAVVALMAGGEDGSGRMLFHWEGVRRYGARTPSMRVRLTLSGDDTWNVAALDELGAPVVSAEAIVARPVEAEQLALARRGGGDAQLRVEWVEAPVPSTNGHKPRFAVLAGVDAGGLGEDHADLGALVEAIDGGAQAPDVVLATVPHDGGAGAAESARAGVHATIELLKAWLGDERLSGSRLVLVTREGVAARDGEEPDLGAAAVWGLVRSAQGEHPGRFGLLDTDGSDASWQAAAVLLAAGEEQLALREGVARVPRVARAAASSAAAGAEFDPEGTVLITGGTGGLGALVARHLAAEHGVRHLLLVSRRGAEAPEAAELEAGLTQLGATPVLAACDIADRDELAALIASVAPEHPLKSVIHAAGVIEDGLVDSLTPEQVDRVMRPKADGALNLHELTEGLEHFVVFSSFAATLGSPGQGNYSAGNAFLDALAQRRIASGLPAKSLVYGAWAEAGGMTRDRSASEAARIRRLGAALLTSDEGLALFDAAMRSDEPLPVLVRLETSSLRVMARDGTLPPILSGLVRARAARSGEAPDSLQKRLSGVPEADWPEVVVDMVRDHIASVLGLESRDAVDARLAFKEMGFDSLAAVELRNRLNRSTRLQLPATLVFDHPTPAAVAEHMLGKLPSGGAAASGGTGGPPIDAEFERMERLVQEMATDERSRTQVEARLRSFNARVQTLLMDTGDVDGADDGDVDDVLDAVSDEEMFALIDEELGSA